jgi:hypothetical protein
VALFHSTVKQKVENKIKKSETNAACKLDSNKPPKARGSVAEFAEELGVRIHLLMAELHAAGIKKESPEEIISTSDKAALFAYLRNVHKQ